MIYVNLFSTYYILFNVLVYSMINIYCVMNALIESPKCTQISPLNSNINI